MDSHRLKSFLAFLLLSAWLTALFLPVVEAPYPAASNPTTAPYVIDGTGVLASGWAGLAEAQFAWFGNLALAWLLIRASVTHEQSSGNVYVLISCLLLTCAGSALAWDSLYLSGQTVPITHFHSGYFLWLAVMGAGAIWSLFLARNRI